MIGPVKIGHIYPHTKIGVLFELQLASYNHGIEFFMLRSYIDKSTIKQIKFTERLYHKQ